MEKIIFAIILVSIISILCSCNTRYEREIVTGKIIEKDYDKATTKKVRHTKKVGKTTKTYYDTKYVPAEYELTAPHS